MDLPVALYTAKQLRELDRLAIQSSDSDGYALMCLAGKRCWALIQRTFPGATLDIVCGAGNNAGDGYVLARLAMGQGVGVNVYAISDPDSLSGEASQAYEDFISTGGMIYETLPKQLSADVVVDALLGIGGNREVTGGYLQAVNTINASASPVVAVDIPSGLCADTGAVLGSAVKAQVTMTFIGLKRGQFTAAGPQQCGRIEFDSLGVVQSVYEAVPLSAQRITQSLISRCLAPRNLAAHKGDFGRVLIVGGNQGMPGAVRLAGEAALRSGAGIVQIATHPSHGVPDRRPELMVAGINSAAELMPLLEQASVVAVGPGLGTNGWAQELWQACLSFAGPTVVDADGLNLLAAAPARRSNWILTPHPGELGRLLDLTSAQVQADRFSASEQLQARFGGVAVTKGPGTLVNDGKNLSVCTLGNPGMATAGMGDVLTGVVAAMLGQGLSLPDASRVGVTVHSAAGDLAAGSEPRGMLAMDVVDQLRRVVNL